MRRSENTWALGKGLFNTEGRNEAVSDVNTQLSSFTESPLTPNARPPTPLLLLARPAKASREWIPRACPSPVRGRCQPFPTTWSRRLQRDLGNFVSPKQPSSSRRSRRDGNINSLQSPNLGSSFLMHFLQDSSQTKF